MPSTLAVIGLGYIGLPTAIAFARNGWDVTGVDLNEKVVASVNEGRLPFKEEGMEVALREALASGRLHAQSELRAADVYVIAVPTPFQADKTADLSYIRAACDEVGKVAQSGDLVLLESTSPPGTTEKVRDWVSAASPFGGEGIFYAHAPERVLPGRILVELAANDRVVGGLTPKASQLARDVYQTFVTGGIHMTDALTAEMAKLAENSFRDVNIAFANELSLVCAELGIDVWELIDLANRHPRVNILEPGPGVGGHCIAVDPWFIINAAPESANLIRTAREVNDHKPRWVVEQVQEAIVRQPEAVVGVFGLAFKSNIDDLRESPALEIATALAEAFPGSTFDLVEPHIDVLPDALASLPNVRLSDVATALTECSVVLLLVDHAAFSKVSEEELAGKTIIDTKGQWTR